MSLESLKPVCVGVGVGPGNGAAFARRFGLEGYRVALLARRTEIINELAKEIDGAKAYACDVADAASIASVFAAIRAEMGPVDTLIYNPGAGIWKNVEEITPDEFEQSWRVNALGALLVAKQVIPDMKKNRQGNIVFIGATQSGRIDGPPSRPRRRSCRTADC